MGSEIIQGRVNGEINILHSGKRVSDTERDAIIRTLTSAAGSGYISPETHEARVQAAMKARSQYELENLTADLPVSKPSVPQLLRHFTPWIAALVFWLTVMIPVPVWVYDSTEYTVCSGSGSNNCWNQNPGWAVAATIGLVIFGLIGVLVTVALFFHKEGDN